MRMSISIVYSGTVLGVSGPAILFTKGEKQNMEFTKKYLIIDGLAPGSTIIMNENAYMNVKAWMQASKSIVKGYWELLYVKENKKWFIADMLDGFKSHENLLQSHQLCSDNYIISLKE